MSLVDKKVIDNLLETAFDLGMDVDCMEGVLVDNYVIYNSGPGDLITIRGKVFKYIFVEEQYLNCWSSGYNLTCSNLEKKYDEFINRHPIEEEE